MGKLAPSKIKKAGVLTLDGRARYVRLAEGKLTIYESSDASKATETLVIFRAPIKYVKIVGDGHTASTVKQHRFGVVADNEIRIYVEPEAVNQEHNAHNSADTGFGWTPGHVMAGPLTQMTSYTGDCKRQNFSLFASDKTAKHAWQTTLGTTAGSARDWHYVSHEIKDTTKYVTGKKR